MRLNMFKIFGVLAVTAWLAVLGALVQGGPSDTVAPTVTGERQSADEDEWYGLYMNGEKIGYAHNNTENTGAGYKVSEYVNATFNMMGTVRELEVDSVSRLDNGLALSSFEYKVNSAEASMEVSGVAEGRMLHIQMKTGGAIIKKELPMSDSPHLSSDIGLLMKMRGYKPGDTFEMPFFDPSSLSEQKMKITVESGDDMKVGGDVLPVYVIRQEFAGIESITWYNPDYGTIKSVAPMGFTLLRETREQAVKPPVEGYAAADLINMFSVPVKGNLPQPRRAKYARLRLTGGDMTGLDLNGGRQSYKDGVITITVEDTGNIEPVKLPIQDEWLGGSLEPTALIQSDSNRIIAQARDIIGSETDALRSAEAISGWVYGELDKLPSAGIPSALEVLDNRYGDCNEHTVLFTALARSVGIPTRMCAGLVMLDNRFYYHAWPEVYVGKWVAIDPSFGQFPADATHIRLVYGGPDKQIAIVKIVGNIEAELLEAG